MRWLILILALIACISTDPAAAQNKVALVIGNDLDGSLLGNPARDSKIVGEALQKIGFKLVGGQPLVGLNKEAMEAQVEEFGKLAKNADIALFYFSGHGLQLNGTNFLVPVGFQSGKSPIVHALSTTVLMAELARSQARVKIVLLDACRTPFMKGGDGLAPMQDFAVNGTVIGFATQPNRTAWAGPPNGNSPYAKAFATKLSVKGLQLYDLLIDVGLEVMSVTQNAQVPSATITPLRVVLNQNQIVPSPGTTPPNPAVLGNLPNGQALRFVQSAHKLLDNKNFGAARDELTKGIQLDPGLGLTYNYRGYAWYEEGLSKPPIEGLKFYDKAFLDFDEAIRLSPTYAPAYRHRGNTILATFKALRKIGKPTNKILDNAINDFNMAIGLDSNSKTSPNSLGGAYLLKGDYASAIKNFNIAIALNQTYAAPYAGLCATYRLMGNAKLADDYERLAGARDDDKSKACVAQQH